MYYEYGDGNMKNLTIENEVRKILKIIKLGNYGYHHILEMENGNLLLAVNKDGAVKIDQSGKAIKTVEYHIIEIERESGKIIKEWDIRKILDVNRLYQGMGKSGEIQLTDTIVAMMKGGEKILAYNFEGKRYDIGNKFELLKANIEFGLRNEEIREELLEFIGKLEMKLKW